MSVRSYESTFTMISMFTLAGAISAACTPQTDAGCPDPAPICGSANAVDGCACINPDTGPTPGPEAGPEAGVEAGTGPGLEAGTGCSGKEVVIEDDNFATGWSDRQVSLSGEAQYTSEHRSSEGNPGAFRYVGHTVYENTVLWVAHEKAGAVYDPANGAIESIRFSMDAHAISGRQASVSMLVMQGGKTYWTYFSLINESDEWVTRSWTDAQLAPFGSKADAGKPGPDLSSNGGALQFGFLTGASHTGGVEFVLREAGIDNWRVVLCTAP